MKKQKLILSILIVSGAMAFWMMFVSITKLGHVAYAGTSVKEVPEECLGDNGQVPAEYSGTGNYVSGSGEDLGTVSIRADGSIIEVDYEPNPPFSLPKVACIETADSDVINWHPAGRAGGVYPIPGGVTIDTENGSYPIDKEEFSRFLQEIRQTTSVETVWMLWGEAPFPVYVPIVTQ